MFFLTISAFSPSFMSACWVSCPSSNKSISSAALIPSSEQLYISLSSFFILYRSSLNFSYISSENVGCIWFNTSWKSNFFLQYSSIASESFIILVPCILAPPSVASITSISSLTFAISASNQWIISTQSPLAFTLSP